MAKSRLHELSGKGVSVWFDTLSRDLVQTGELKRMMDDDAVVGVTSNPTIFQKALSTGNAYDEDMKKCLESTDDPTEIFFSLALQDIRDACDVLKPAYDASNGVDGYVSMEVLPSLAYDAEATFDQVQRISKEVDRPNLYVKIPATAPGLPAIEDSIAHGTSINITLIFSLERYKAVVEAYLRGLERLVAGGGDPSKVTSVASFFVSRVDTEADKRLEGHPDLQGKLAIANAKLAYQYYLEAIYVEELVGPETVNTMPLETIRAFQEHGEVRGDTVLEGIDEARELLGKLEEAGVSYDDVVETLEQEGVQKFADSF